MGTLRYRDETGEVKELPLPRGPRGYTPKKGVDYFTPEDVEEIVKKAKENAISISGASVGQVLEVAAVDEQGVPTAWETTDISNEWKLIADFTTTEEVASFAVTKRLDGSPLKIDGSKDILCYCIAAPSATNTAKAPTEFRVDSVAYSYVKDSVYTNTYYTCRWLKIENYNGKIVYSCNGNFGYSKSLTGFFAQMSHHYDLYNRTSKAYPIESIGYDTNGKGVFGIGSRILIYERGNGA